MLLRLLLPILRPLAFVVVLIAAGFWLLRPGYWTARLSRSADSAAQQEVDEVTAQLAAENPEAAAALRQMAEKRDMRAAAAAMRYARHTAGLTGVQQLADRIQNGEAGDYEAQLAEIALRPSLLADDQQREEFIWAHATVLQTLQAEDAGPLAADYMQRVEASTHDAANWRVAKNNAMALLVLEQLTDPKLGVYYEREQDWLDELLLELTALGDGSETPAAALISATVAMAAARHPHFKSAVVEDRLGATANVLFDEFADVIVAAIESGGLPRSEVLEVVFANRDFLSQRLETKPATEVAASLALLKAQQPAVWDAARQTAFALRLHQDVPEHADLLLDRYGSDDIATFLYAGYPEDLSAAAAAVAMYGDLAVYILNRYTQSNPFRSAIRDETLGPRVIPYVARFGDQGLERLEENRGWLDKHFQADGTSKDEEWWTQIPGGGAVDVARNLAKGYPSEWSELGWAALDTADALLLVASLGSSSVVTVPVKQGGKAAAKSLSRAEARRAVLAAGRARAARQLAPEGLRVAARTEATSLLRRAIAQGGHLAVSASSIGSRSWRLAALSGRSIAAPMARLASSARAVRNSWLGVSPVLRRITYRSLLATGLMITITQRTIPALTEIAESVGGFAGQLAADAAHATAAGLAEAVNHFAQGLAGGEGVVPVWLIYVVVLVVLAALAWYLRPRFQEKLRYVG